MNHVKMGRPLGGPFPPLALRAPPALTPLTLPPWGPEGREGFAGKGGARRARGG